MVNYARWQRFIVDGSGNLRTNVSIEVRSETIGGSPLATLYSARTGTALANPFTTGSDGLAAFHAVGDAYKVRAYEGPSGAPTWECIFRYEGVGTASEYDYDALLKAIPDGTVGAPGLAFASDPDCGLYRIGANNVGMSIGGAKVMDWAAALLGIVTATAITINSANALAVGRQGATNPVLQVDAATASVVTGWKLTGAAAAGGAALSVISSGTNENGAIDAKGSGTLTLNGTATGGITLGRALTYGGVTLSNAVTGTGNMVLSASPTFTGTAAFANITASGTLSVTGTSNLAGNIIGGAGGTGSVNFQVTFNGGSGANGGAFFGFAKNSSINWYLGHQSGIFGGGSTNSDLTILNASTGVTTMRVTVADDSIAWGSTLEASSTTVAGAKFAGGIGVVKAAFIGGLLNVASTITGQNSILSTHATAGIGYGTGAGGTVTQATSKSTGVTLNKVCGQITMNNAALNAGASVSFTLTNSAIAATDTVRVNIQSAATVDSYNVDVTAVAAGSCRIQVRNFTAGNLSEALVLNFTVMKGVTS